MPEPLSADRTAEMLLWYFEQSARYHTEGVRRDAPFLDPQVVLKLALGRHAGLTTALPRGVETAATLKAAAAMYVHHLFFRPDATPYQTLGLLPGASPEAIKESFRLLMQLVHPDRQEANAEWPDAFAAQANRAYGILRNEDSREQFDREAASRAEMARGVHRAAAASSAPRAPVPKRPKPRSGRLPSAPGQLPVQLPEWLTDGVGRHVREHPAAAAFALFTGIALITVGLMVSDRQDGGLTRDVQQTAQSKVKVPVQAMASVARVSDAASSPAPRAASPPTPQAQTSLAKAPTHAPEPAAATPMPSPPPIARAEPPAATPMPSPPPARAEPPAATPMPSPPSTARAEPPAATPMPSPPSTARAEPPASIEPPAPVPLPPAATEIEALFATFVDTYERGRLDAFAALFDEDADTNIRRGRAAIRGEYDELFRLSEWRRMQLTGVNWQRVGDRAIGKGEIMVKIGWRDGREVEQRLAVDVELVRRDGRVVIAKLAHRPKN